MIPDSIDLIHKISYQIEAILDTCLPGEFKDKFYALTMEWYLQGLHYGMQHGLDQKYKELFTNQKNTKKKSCDSTFTSDQIEFIIGLVVKNKNQCDDRVD